MKDDRSTGPSAEHVRAVLDALRDDRGFVLPHHGAMAAALPELHGAYRAMYRALTLDRRHLSELERECAWVAMLAALGEGVGTHHVRAFRAAGGDDSIAGALFGLAGWAAGARLHRFLDADWARHFPGVDPARAYRDGVATFGAGLPPGVAWLSVLAIHVASDEPWGLRVALEAAYAAGVAETAMAEAMSLAIWPRGVNPFVRACGTWLEVLRSGAVTPSPAFAAWRDTPDQGALRLGG